MLFCVGNHSARYLVRTIQWDIAYVFHDVHPESSETLLVFFRGKFRIFWTAPGLFLTSPQVWRVESQHHRATQHGRPMFRQCLGSQTAMGWDGVLLLAHNDRVSTSEKHERKRGWGNIYIRLFKSLGADWQKTSIEPSHFWPIPRRWDGSWLVVHRFSVDSHSQRS